MNTHIAEFLGWIATGIFAGSYFFSRPAELRITQMLGALLWIAYGGLIKSWPVIVANGLVIAAAAWTALRQTAARPTE